MTARAEDNYLEALLLERYCSDTASSAEAARIEAWFRVHPDQRVWYEQFKTEVRKQKYSLMSAENRIATIEEIIRAALQQRPAYDGKHGGVTSFGQDAASLAYQTAPEGSGHRLSTGPQTLRNVRQKEGVFSGHTLRQGMWFTAAALVLGSVVLVAGWMAGVRHNNWRATQPTLTYATDNGERATITLPDGGTVILNVASRLEVPVDYLTGHHTVRLVGEGLFTVPHHEGAPFTVLAGTTAARVLGTSFVVRRYATDTATLVAVRGGKVAVGTVVVMAAHSVEVGPTGVLRVRPSDASPFTFATGVLTLSGLPLPTAIAELDRWYDADIRLGSPALTAQHITGAFTAGSLSDLTGFLEFVLGVRVVRAGRVLTLFPKG